MLVYWPGWAVPAPVQVIEAPTASVDDGQVTATPSKVAHHDAREHAVAGVGDVVGPRDRRADGDERPGRRVGIVAIGELLELDSALDAEVVRGIVIRHDLPGRGQALDRADVRVLADRRGCARLAGERRARKDQRRLRTRQRGDEVVGDAPAQRDIAGVGDRVRPTDGAADAHHRAGRHVGIDTVDQLLDVDRRVLAEVVRRVRILDGDGAGDARRRRRVLVGPSDGGPGAGARHRRADRERVARA